MTLQRAKDGLKALLARRPRLYAWSRRSPIVARHVAIDVEGFELPVVRGLSSTIERHRPIILVETSRTFADLLELRQALGVSALRIRRPDRRAVSVPR